MSECRGDVRTLGLKFFPPDRSTPFAASFFACFAPADGL